MKTPKPLVASPLEAHLGFWLRYVSNQVSARFQSVLEDQGTTVTEWVALRTLFDRSETTHAELIQSLGMTKGAASKVVSRLQEKGLAARWLVEGSSREQVLALTPQGMTLVPKLAALADQNDEHFFGHLSQTERSALMKTFKSVVAQHQLKEVPVA
jgi:DNA-binding MarR family transcriptional regulator